MNPQNATQSSAATNAFSDISQGSNPNAQSAVTEQPKPLPGYDLMDGVMNIVAFPGRALVKLYKAEPDASDLPIILILSAAFWGGAWWLASKYLWSSEENEIERKFRKKRNATRKIAFIKKAKPTVIDVEDESEDDE